MIFKCEGLIKIVMVRWPKYMYHRMVGNKGVNQFLSEEGRFWDAKLGEKEDKELKEKKGMCVKLGWVWWTCFFTLRIETNTFFFHQLLIIVSQLVLFSLPLEG